MTVPSCEQRNRFANKSIDILVRKKFNFKNTFDRYLV